MMINAVILAVASAPVSLPEYHPAIIWFYLSIALISLVAGSAVLRANRYRATNVATGLLFLLVGVYFIAYGFIYLNPVTAAIYIRVVLAVGGQFLSVLWFLRLSICSEGASVRELLRRSKWVWATGVVYAALAVSPGMIPYESTWDNKMWGPLWVPLQGLWGVVALALLGRIMLDCRRLKGAKLFEAKMVAGGATVVVVLLSFRGALRVVLTGDFSPFAAGIGGMLMLGLVLFGVVSPRLFAARSIFLALATWSAAIIGAGVVYTAVLRFGLGLDFPLGITGISAAGSGLGVWYLLTLFFRRVRWSRQNQITVELRERILKLGSQGLDVTQMAELVEGLLGESFGTTYCRVYRARDLELIKGSSADGGPGVIEDYLEQRRWVSRESLDRGWQTDEARWLMRWLREQDGELLVRGVGDVSGQGVLIVLGERRDEVIFSYPEIVSLLEIANSVSFVMETVELEGKGRDLGKIQAMEMLSATIGHDMKQHLVVMQLLADRVRMPDVDANAREDYLSRIAGEITKMNRFSSRLMTLSEVPSLLLASVNVSELMAEFERTIRVAASDTGVQIELDIEEGLRPVLADERSLQRALNNLGINAIEAMTAGVKEDQTKGLKIRANSSRGRIRIEIEDTGPGLPENILESLFEPFVASSKTHGHGLGLYIVWDSIVRMGGRVTHEVPETGGTRFVISLPQSAQD